MLNRFLGLVLTALPLSAAAVAPFTYSEDFGNFGAQTNLCPVSNPKGICAAVASINSFIYLENQFPTIYGNLLTPNVQGTKPTQTDQQDSLDFGVNGWQVGTNPVRQGYYPRPGNAYDDYIATKMDWINDHAPGTTMFEARYSTAGGVPDVAWLAAQVQAMQDVEFFVQGTGFFHAVTLTGVSCTGNDYTGCSLTYIDPNSPLVNQSATLSSTVGGLQITDLPGSNYTGTVTITGAFAESPTPEPGTWLLALVGVAWVSKRKYQA